VPFSDCESPDTKPVTGRQRPSEIFHSICHFGVRLIRKSAEANRNSAQEDLNDAKTVDSDVHGASANSGCSDGSADHGNGQCSQGSVYDPVRLLRVAFIPYRARLQLSENQTG
jgi:hypothetical protein